MTSLNMNWRWKRQETKLNAIWKQINIKNNTITPSAVRVYCVEKIKGQILMLLFVFAQFYLVESVENVSVSGEIRILQNYMISSVD